MGYDDEYSGFDDDSIPERSDAMMESSVNIPV